MGDGSADAIIDLTEEERAVPRRQKRSRQPMSTPTAAEEEVLVVDDEPTSSAPPTKRGRRRQGGAGASGGASAEGGITVVGEEEAPWKGKRGTKRIMSEFSYIASQIEAGTSPIHDLQLVKDDITRWQFKVKDFDDDAPGGRQLNADLQELASRHGQDHILMEIRFPRDYPTQPFMLRVITPRMMWYTGHVTAGGSICVEALSNSGSRNAWRSDYCVAGLLDLIKTNMIHVESVVVRTQTGPGGRAGPLRIDLHRQWNRCPVMMPYNEAEAVAAFQRTEAHHAHNGW
mmetsp:Transcript_16843/g.55098  ORF Transcript_16843/g.55098 Transcript_16843/m.55098 type:complete len:287 (-) Transcript_16843:119-979(-)|eukprot:CAMPEP_0170146088 /NCGR_PEP_ID=MMETSP0033_2-20121228/28127_1 /TAXON_ID=195969 /ORGANISM="Dolichomastix tenuilepis, Strain CCMP3274" /LENGTH=286 /DNA_ID=CAMNT_0010382765 /DNA_START=126 /DNA_END=986 /DNA_ORIENTATION=+